MNATITELYIQLTVYLNQMFCGIERIYGNYINYDKRLVINTDTIITSTKVITS